MNTGIKNERLRTALVVALLAALAIVALLSSSVVTRNTSAQSARPVLISEANSTRAIALDSVTRLREPFSTESPVQSV